VANSIEKYTKNLPDSEGAKRFYEQLAAQTAQIKMLEKSEGLLSDVLTIAAFSPLLSTTLLQNPAYFSWLKQQRKSAKVRDKDEILESLARFALTNSTLETNVLLARFRRRELLRIYLQDIRNLGTIAEITEDISNLADAILEYALRIARQQLDNRYGTPLETDDKNRARAADFCIVALGKLGSKELNYASDIDLLFLYSADGTTSGHGERGAVTNREYFVKLAEFVTKLVGAPTGEGAAYRVDLRLRPNGRVGALAISVKEAIDYYKNSARSWERQVLIRSRASAGNGDVFRKFFQSVEDAVFSPDETLEAALENVRLSKEKINLEKFENKGFNVKLGRGGIREIEFIAQALQLAYGGRDEWLRAPHTLISLARLADRNLITERELTALSDAYAFLRRVEHRLQMENGLQTHLVPENEERKFLLARRMNFENLKDFENEIKTKTDNVNRVFTRIFDKVKNLVQPPKEAKGIKNAEKPDSKTNLQPIFSSLEKSDIELRTDSPNFQIVEKISEISPHFAQIIAANPNLIRHLPELADDFPKKNYRKILSSAISAKNDFAAQIAALRKNWSRLLLEIVVFDVFGKIELEKAKRFQTELAEASIEAAIFITRRELEKRFSAKMENFAFAVLGLGKLGGGGLDYDSDLDLILIYDDEKPLPVPRLTHAEFYSRAVEIFVNSLSSFTREGHLYRVDLRLRPDGKNGATSTGKTAFLNYLQNRAALWELLAYVKLRAVGGDPRLAEFVETEARKIIHQTARKPEISADDFQILRQETKRVRARLEAEKSVSRAGREIDIKFGAGGMLDVYFAVRFLQLRDNLPDDSANRSTVFTLEKLYRNNSIGKEDYENFSDGYKFLSCLDHNLRLTVGRSTRLPLANQKSLQIIADRMNLESVKNLLEKLAFHRLEIRASFEGILG
jgi:[glutamine synthetase] adenylyltransferase / [glutamine synthetase]-adenylyl-L-tyrosine phosphorylase